MREPVEIDARRSLGGRPLWLLRVNVVITVVLGATLLGVGRVGDSSSLIAEGWHSLGDGILGLLSVYTAMLSARGADAQHPYGRAKFEHLGGAIMGGVLLVLAAEMSLDFIEHAASGVAHRPAFSDTGTIVLCGLAAVRCAWALVMVGVGRNMASVAVEVEARHAGVDAFVTCAAVGAALFGQRLPWADLAAGFAIVAVVSLTGVRLLRAHAPWLADRSVVPSYVVEQVLSGFCSAFSVRSARSRGTPQQAFVEVVVEAVGSRSLEEASAMARAIEEHIRRAIPEVAEVLVVVDAPSSHEPTSFSAAG